MEVVRSAGLHHEMELAQKVQMAMIPATPPQVAGLSAVGWARTASVTGGDAYDLWANGRWTDGNIPRRCVGPWNRTGAGGFAGADFDSSSVGD